MFFTVTAAPVITAPTGSETVPASWPVSTCADKAVAPNKLTAKTPRARIFSEYFMVMPLSPRSRGERNVLGNSCDSDPFTTVQVSFYEEQPESCDRLECKSSLQSATG